MERRLTAILAADVVGYSRMMGADETGTMLALKAVQAEVVDHQIAAHHGRLVKLTGDGILVEFSSVVNAVACASAIQREMRERNASIASDRRLQFRIGVNLGDVMVDGDDIYGDGVNVAARLESVAPPGGITVSESVHQHVGNRLDLVFEDRGEQQLKNIAQVVRIYDVGLEQAKDAPRAKSKNAKPSIAVLPFNNMSGDPEQEYFGDGITEDLITDLSKVSGLSVVARHTSFTYKNKAVKVQQVGQELGVGFILEGSVRKAGSRVRITGQLINARDGGHLWAERFDRDLTDIFAIQDEITRVIVAQLKVKLLPQEEEAIGTPPTASVEAYTYYLRGREFFYRGSKNYFPLARRMFVKASELDPLYARAYAGIADCDSFMFLHYDADVGVDNLLATTAKALELDPRLAEAHASRGVALSAAERHEEATVEFQEAVRLGPNSFEAHYLYARASVAQGMLERAATLFERAAEIRPNDYQPPCLLINIYRSLGRREDVKAAARSASKLAEQELALHPDDPRPATLGIAALIELGETDRAREWMTRALAIAPDDPSTQYNLACGYTKLGDIDTAFDLLEASIPHSGPEIMKWIKHDSDFDDLRNYPRYQKILELIGK
ncbi:MAG: adenylate/guanylate cyclase domain-containing protein [Verrucomicrobiota bacterium]